MPMQTDSQLIAAYAEAGDDPAFAELVARYQTIVYRTCLRVLGNAPEAEDATQATFIVLARKAGSLRREGALGGWLHRVARNVALQALARLGKRARRQEELAMWQERAVAPEVAPDLGALRQRLDEELDGLSAVLREAVILRHLRGLSEKDAAMAAGCPVSAMKWRTSDGLAKLRARLTQRGLALDNVALLGLLAGEASGAVPEALASSVLATVKSAAGAGAATTAGSAKALTLAKGALKMLFWAKVKTAAAAVVLTAGVAAGGGLVAHQALAHRVVTPSAPMTPARPQPAPLPAGMALIPAGTNAGTDPDGRTYRLTVDRPFLMDRGEVTKALWDEVLNWSADKGYRYRDWGAWHEARTGGADNGSAYRPQVGLGKAPNHPVSSVYWYDCVIWCNARSQKDGLEPVYYADAACREVYQDAYPPEGLRNPHVKEAAAGYRLPTATQWLYAARGGQVGHRFPWADAETVAHTRANYRGADAASSTWDLNRRQGCHPTYAVGEMPFTSPVGAFAPNAYGLYDMCGNVGERLAEPDEQAASSWADPAYTLGHSGLIQRHMQSTNIERLGLRCIRYPAASLGDVP